MVLSQLVLGPLAMYTLDQNVRPCVLDMADVTAATVCKSKLCVFLFLSASSYVREGTTLFIINLTNYYLKIYLLVHVSIIMRNYYV